MNEESFPQAHHDRVYEFYFKRGEWSKEAWRLKEEEPNRHQFQLLKRDFLMHHRYSPERFDALTNDVLQCMTELILQQEQLSQDESE